MSLETETTSTREHCSTKAGKFHGRGKRQKQGEIPGTAKFPASLLPMLCYPRQAYSVLMPVQTLHYKSRCIFYEDVDDDLTSSEFLKTVTVSQ